MDFETYKELTEDEQRAAFIEQKTVDDLTAECDSFKSENDRLRKELADLKESERKTKEVNYTLSRQLNVGAKKADAEQVLHDMFK